MVSEAVQTPLLDMLDRIPADGRATYEHDSMSHSNIPYGYYAAEAAKRIRELERENETTLQSLMDQLTLKGYYVTLDAHPGGVLEAILLGEHERIKSEEETDMFNSIAEALEWCVARVSQPNNGRG